MIVLLAALVSMSAHQEQYQKVTSIQLTQTLAQSAELVLTFVLQRLSAFLKEQFLKKGKLTGRSIGLPCSDYFANFVEINKLIIKTKRNASKSSFF